MLASDAARAVGGRLVGADVAFEGASFDSRTLRVGQLFVPIVADRDGHDFIAAAIGRGAPVHLTMRADLVPDGVTAIVVDDTARALLDLAAAARKRFGGTVVGVTGSVGKTSTKDFIGAAVGASRRVHVNPASFNNDQGLPITILGAPDDTEVLAVEMGMRGFGEIARLCRIARPTVGVVTRVGHSHTERVGGIEGVAVAKRELVEALGPSATAVLNADDDRVLAMARHTAASVVTYGATGDVRIERLVVDEEARARFTAQTPWGAVETRLGVTGAHMVSNAAAALAVAGVVGADLGAAAAALADAQIAGMRMQVVRAPSGATVVNDAYNANPTSMEAALHALAAMSAARRVAVVGRMAEIDDAEPAHRAIAATARGLGIELVAVDTDLYGVAPIGIDEVASALGPLGPDTVVLVKASRSVGLERVVAALTEW